MSEAIDNPARPFVLIVDDEWRFSQNLKRFLDRRGYDVMAVSSVTAANEAITERRPDVALIDLKLPDFDGTELCRMLHARHPETRLLVMSARVDEADERTLRALGVSHLLTKPFPLQSLATCVADMAETRVAPMQRIMVEECAVPELPSAVPEPARSGPRIALYSHDTMGLGHMRRNILIARSLAESSLNATVLLVSGAREIGRFDLPSGIDCLVLPSYRKSSSGAYESRHLDLQTQDLVRLRAQTINASLQAFDPDVMVVDNVPRGALNELDSVLTGLSARGRTRLVLGLRDVLDDPETTRAEWERRKNLPSIQWHYDEVWVYGDPKIYNLCEAYGFGEAFDRKVQFTGYLDARKRAAPRQSDILSPSAEDVAPIGHEYNLCLVGGGQDGYSLAKAFAEAKQPSGNLGLLVTGPFMEPEQIEQLRGIAGQRDDLQVLGFVQEPTHLLQNARRVVAMGGYNTVNEVLAFRRPTLIVPRVRPRREQLVRAIRLADLGYVDMLHPEILNPVAVSHWLQKDPISLPYACEPIDLAGLDRLADYVKRLTNPAGTRHATA